MSLPVSDPGGRLPVHRLHDEEIERLLASGERKAELTALFGDKAYRELAALAKRADARRARGGPRVYVLPGLMGSRLGTRGVLLDDVLWVDIIEIAAGHLTRLALPGGAKLVALGAILLNALKLKLSLRIAGFDTHLHAYDWRRSIGTLADELNARIAAEAGMREVLLVGHSMGGVVARVAHGRQAQTRIVRVVQLGAPNHGSFAPVLALRGVYPTVRKLAALDRRHSAEDLARIVFRTLPALHELLPDPALTEGPVLFDAAQWPRDALRPEASLLHAAAREQAGWPAAHADVLHIAGVRQDTVTSVKLREQQFDFGVTALGDGTVPLALAVRPGDKAWYVGEKHGGLPNNGRVIAAVVDLLRSGATRRLPQTASPPRRRMGRALSEAALRRIAPHKVRWQDLSPDARRRLLEPVVSPEFHGAVVPAALEAPAVEPGLPPQAGSGGRGASRRRVIELRLTQGSIVDANARALVLGVFRNVDPTGAAAAVDRALGGAIKEFALRRMFAAQLGQVFVMPATRSALLAELVLFAGLGVFDDFGGDAQSFVSENVIRTFARTHVEDFATVLFGAGSGVPVAVAVEHQLRGLIDGLRHADPDGVIRRITVCEIDPRKFAALSRAVRRLAPALAGADFELVIDAAVAPIAPPASARVARRATERAAQRRNDPAYLLVTLATAAKGGYECRGSLLTAGAKAAVLSGGTTFGKRDLERELAPLERGSATTRDLPRIGSALARLLLSANLREGLETMRSRPLVIVHDREASRIPWEVLRIGTEHPALVAGASRRYASETLTVARWRDDGPDHDALRVLLVVDPTSDLPGAADEGELLAQIFTERGVLFDRLEQSAATRARILAALAAGTYDVLHFAGHAFFDPDDPGRSGLVCHGQQILRGTDLDDLGHLPALVFCNACEAARVRKRDGRNAAATRTAATRRLGLRRSASVAEAFLTGGVANFLGTHWPVGDDAALEFSQGLYAALVDGATLGDAVLVARKLVAARRSIDWADYVHYGNPDFRLALHGAGADDANET
jgi:hypothetical protein